jgi:hypothetical protein
MKTLHKVLWVPFVIALCTATSFVGCSDKTVSPGTQPQVTNETNTFEFQVTAVQNYSGVWRYRWATTATVADVDQSCAITGGDATLVVRDGGGQTVYSRALGPSGTYQTVVGSAGEWTLEIVMIECSGTLNFRTQKNQ